MNRKIGSLAFFAVLSVRVLTAQGFPPVVTKSFTPSLVGVNQVSTLTITLTNPNSFALSGGSISDTFPAGLVNAGPFPGTASSTCAGAILSPGPSSLFMSNATIPANGSCTITAPVLSGSAGSYQNSTGSLFTGSGTSLGGGTATLTVVASDQIPTLSSTMLLLLAMVISAAALGRMR
ncbi:MAG: mucin9 [Thermoanaerobaculia bacterium]|nr:mucin9 [Thermoanaerobaculia bacterium]